jgi:hypothetical protein
MIGVEGESTISEVEGEGETQERKAPQKCGVNYQNPKNRFVHYWQSSNACSWRSQPMNEEKRYELYTRWKTCFLCKRKGCNFCIEKGDGLTWKEPIDFICEYCLELNFPSEVEQVEQTEEK